MIKKNKLFHETIINGVILFCLLLLWFGLVSFEKCTSVFHNCIRNTVLYQKCTTICDKRKNRSHGCNDVQVCDGEVFHSVMTQLYHKSLHHRYLRLHYRVLDDKLVMRCKDKGAGYLFWRYIKKMSVEAIVAQFSL